MIFAFLINNSEDGIILNSGTPIAGTGGVSKVMAVVLAGTVLTGDLIITGIKVDRVTGIETPGSTETIPIDGLSTDNSTTDSNGNPVYSYIDNYISADWWKGPLVFSTPDLDLSEIRFAQVAFEQFDDVENLTIDSLVEKVKTGSIKEVVFALSSTMEGDTTNFYIYKQLDGFDVKLSTIARGISVGDELEYADEVTLGRSIVNRIPFENSLQS